MTSHSSPLIWVFCSKRSNKKINAVHERFLRDILNDDESPYSFLLEEAHQIKLHQQFINSHVIGVYKYLNRHLPDIMNDIFKLRENMYNIFQTESRR